MNKDIVEEIKDSIFQLDCFEIILIQNTKNNPKTYTGPGVIYQEKDGLLKFKVFPPGEIDKTEYFFNIPKLGKIIDKEEFFNLKALDFSGDEWFSDNIELSKSINSTFNKMIISGEIRLLTKKKTFPKESDTSHCEIILFGEFDFQYDKREIIKKSIGGNESTIYTLNTISFESQEFNFLIHKEQYGCKITVKTDKKNFKDYKIHRILESLQFVYAKRFEWSIMKIIHKESEKIKIKKRIDNIKKTNHFTPINTSIFYKDSNKYWMLFDSFFSYIVKYTSEKRLHPISRLMNTILASSNSFIEAYALTLSVAVESLVNSEYKFLKGKDIQSLKSVEEIEKFCQFINEYDCTRSFTKRISSLVSSLKQLRAIDYLYFLESKNVIEKKLIKDWKKLRNRYTHFIIDDKLNYQDLFDKCDSVTVLFYKLVFQLIEYSGKYTDYTKENFPLVDFQFKEI
jgi:hypothetical protein